ncbi:hypothetical protein [Streptomyces bacillaris]|uniref:hypothetical protein n=1 Tax=Streptomyces bacillaris TaxID=68179 RepID=UPI003460CAF3
MTTTEWGVSPDPLTELRRRFARVVASDDVEQLLALLAVLPQARVRLDQMEAELTEAARAAGASWSAIGRPLGLASRTAAESRALRVRQGLATGQRDQAAQRAYAARQRHTTDTRPHPADV